MKTLIRKAAIVLMMMSLMSTTAFADVQVTDNQAEPNMKVQLVKQADKVTLTEDKILAIALESNARIAMEIEKATVKGDAAANETELSVIISNLQKKAIQITAVSIKKIERLGGDAIPGWTTVVIGGQTFDVDPIRIIRLR